MKKIFLLFVLLSFFIIGCDYSTNDSSSSYSSSYKSSLSEEKLKVCTYSQMEIETMLKSPSSAQHQACRYNTYLNLGNNTYSVSSYVDAENSFGATIRTNYECEVRLTDANEYYIKCTFL